MMKNLRITLLSVLLLGGGWSVGAAVVTYTGAAGGNWETASNWDATRVPDSADDVYIPSGKVVKVAFTAEVASLTISTNGVVSVNGATTNVLSRLAADTNRTDPVGMTVTGNVTLVGSGSLAIGGNFQKCQSYLAVGGNLVLTNTAALAVYAGPTNAVYSFKTGGARVTVTGITSVASGCWIYPDCDLASGAPVVFDLQDLAIATNGGFNAIQRGYGFVNNGTNPAPAGTFVEVQGGNTWYTTAPGRGNFYTIGGGYGSYGCSYNATYGRTYGYTNAPFHPGSPNGVYSTASARRGGGAIRILARQVVLEGALKADAGPQMDAGGGYGCSSGGGIWVTCETIRFGLSASLSAPGGNYTGLGYTSSGGGGRISVGMKLTPEQIDTLYAGGTPVGLVYEPLRQVATDVGPGRAKRIGDTEYVWAPGTGTSTLVTAPDADKILLVGGNPAGVGTPYPAYGSSTFTNGAPVACSVPWDDQFALASGGRIRYFCQGYTVSNAAGVVASGGATNVTVSLTNNCFLTWNWGARQTLFSATAGPNGTLRVSSATLTNFSEWVSDGATVTAVEAVPNAGYEFLWWAGDVPYAQSTNTVLQYTAGKPRAVTAVFRLAEAPATRSWNGSTTVPGDWLNPALWLPAGNVPGKQDTVIVTRGICWVSNYAEVATLTLVSNAILRVGAITASGVHGQAVDSKYQLPITGTTLDRAELVVRGDLTLTNIAQLGVGAVDQAYAAALQVGGNLSLAGTNKLAVYAGPTNSLFTFKTGGAQVSVGGTLLVATNSWIVPVCDPYTGSPVRFDLDRLVVNAGGGFDASKRGYGRYPTRNPPALAPGVGLWYAIGAGHGGRGGSYNALCGLTYGYSNAPFYAGSLNGDYQTSLNGGGAIRIHARRAEVNGALMADADQTSWGGGPSGGGIWLTAEQRLQIGQIALFSAKGGPSNYGSRGGGGRIALGLRLTMLDLDALFESGQPVSRVTRLNDTEFAARFPGATWTVALSTTGTLGEAGTKVYMEAPLPSGSIILIR